MGIFIKGGGGKGGGLESIVAGTGISVDITDPDNPIVSSTVTDTNDAAKVSANDTTAGYLNGKLVAGSNITFTENNNGGNETLTIAAAGGVTGFTGSQNTASPNNTVNASRLLVDATSTDADAVLQPKGTGAILAQLPDGTATGGNKRGVGSFDFQSSRATNSQVASGSYAIVVGGQSNTSSGNYATTAGRGNVASGSSSVALGDLNTASGSNAVALGKDSTASGNDSVAIGRTASATLANAISIGLTSTASGESSVAIGRESSATGKESAALGYKATASAQSAVAIGTFVSSSQYGSIAYGAYCTANRRGQRVYSSGILADGLIQEEIFLMYRQTTDATQSELSGDTSAPGSTTRISIDSDSSYTFSGLVIARRTDADNESAGYKIEGVIDNNAGTTAFVGTPTVTVLAEDTAAWDVVVEADNTNDALVIKVTGEANKTIRWAASVTLVKIKG